MPSHLRQHVVSAGILKDLGERPQVTGIPHSNILENRERTDSGDTPAPPPPTHTHTLAQGYSGCSGADLLQLWFWRTFTGNFIGARDPAPCNSTAPSQPERPGSFSHHCHGLVKPRQGEHSDSLASWSPEHASLLATAWAGRTLLSAEVKQKMLFWVNVWCSAANGKSLWF